MNLEAFCSKLGDSLSCRDCPNLLWLTPWEENGRDHASDGRVLVRVKTAGQYEMRNMLREFFLFDHGAVADWLTPGPIPPAGVEKCEVCNGRGAVVECSACGGAGIISKECPECGQRPFSLGAAIVAPGYLRLILSEVPDALFENVPAGAELKPIRWKSADGTVLGYLMPLRK